MAKVKKKEQSENVTQDNTEQAKIIFEAMPHIHSIWFDENGAWRFYPTPGAVPVHKEDITVE